MFLKPQTMKESSYLGNLLPLLLCTIALAFSGCSHPAPQVKVEAMDLLELLIDPSAMPPNWSMANYGMEKAIDPYRSSDAAGIVFLSDLYPESFGVGEEVYRFKTLNGAKSDYSNEVGILTQSTSFLPPEWRFQSQTADESFFVCTEYPNITSCTWLARYNRILVELRGSLVTDRFALRDMENITRIIDGKASKLIGKY